MGMDGATFNIQCNCRGQAVIWSPIYLSMLWYKSLLFDEGVYLISRLLIRGCVLEQVSMFAPSKPPVRARGNTGILRGVPRMPHIALKKGPP